MHTDRRLVTLLLAIAMLAASACQPAPRPSPEEWERVWNRAESGVPTRDELLADDGPERCDELLASVRKLRLELLPTPAEAIDHAVQDWIQRAQQIGFDCPIEPDQLDALDHALKDLSVLTAEVRAGFLSVRNQ